MRAILVAALMLVTGVAQAKDAPNTQVLKFRASDGTQDLLSGVALNAAEASRTITLAVGANWAKVIVSVQFTQAAATDLTVTPTCALDGTNYGSLSVRDVQTTGVANVTALVDTDPAGASANWVLEYDVRGYTSCKFVFAGTSGGGSDLVTVQASAVAGN